MTNAISGDFVTVQHVPTRKCWKLTVEVDETNIAQVFSVLGYPTSGESISVGIARLTGPGHAKAVCPPVAADESQDKKRHFSDLQPSNQAALKIADKDFQRFLYEAHTPLWKLNRVGIPAHPSDETRKKTADAVIKAMLQIKSKAELDSNQDAARLWSELLGSYEGWKHGVDTQQGVA